MKYNEWITDRLPTLDEWYVYDQNGGIVPYNIILKGEAWKPIPPCEPYVKPKRYEVVDSYTEPGSLCIFDRLQGRCVAFYLHTQVNAERVAAVYEEMLP